jgi:hypothetical protein
VLECRQMALYCGCVWLGGVVGWAGKGGASESETACVRHVRRCARVLAFGSSDLSSSQVVHDRGLALQL